MITTRSATEIWLIGKRKSDLNTSCLPTNGELVMSCITFHTFQILQFKKVAIQNPNSSS